ncbi:PD40 domain-containing protein [Streptomyces griseus]|uniref:PD40 domain-containing protein n=1 Tax=Streptomyces griseus TaxID=1911 RepID=UPI00055DE963|nr:PD40 domain-containing protein [Streptomyces griseus]
MRGNANGGTTRRVRAALSATVVVCAVTAVLPGAASAGPMTVPGVASDSGAVVERISVATDGTQGDGDSSGGTITADGRRIAFSSSATNLIPGNSGVGEEVFVRDQRTRQTTRMSSITSTIQRPVISGDGQYVAFWGQLFRDTKVFLSQVSSGSTIGINCSGLSCSQPSLSTDGRYIAHVATYTRPPTWQRIEVADWRADTRELVAEFDHPAPSRPSISGDGRFVAYQDGKAEDVFVWDRTDDTSAGPIEGPSKAATLVQISKDGSKIVYLSGSDTYVQDERSGADQLVPNVRGVAIDPTGRYLLCAPHDTTGPSLVLRDLQTGTDEIVSNQPAAAGTDAVSTGGRDVVFQSAADDIVPGDTNGKSDVFVRRFY